MIFSILHLTLSRIQVIINTIEFLYVNLQNLSISEYLRVSILLFVNKTMLFRGSRAGNLKVV